MEHIVRTIDTENAIHPSPVVDTRHDNLSINVGKLFLHHQAYVVLRCLCLINQNHLLRLENCYLPHHLRTNGTGRTGNQDTFPSQQFTYRLQIDIYLFSRQQVLH